MDNQTMILVLILGILIFLMIVLLILVYSGLLYSIKIAIKKPNLTKGCLVYKLYVQNYKTIGEAFRELAKFPVKQQSCMGIYYDNPEEVDPETTRSAVGIFFKERDAEDSKELIKNMEGVGYSVINLPEMQRAIVTKFPYRTQLSIPIAMSRVYSRLMAFIKENRLGVRFMIEYYPHDGYIHFIAPIENHDAYIVEECSADPPPFMVH